MKDFRLQAQPSTQAAFRRAQESFADQEANIKQLQKNMDQLFQTSHKLRQKCETTRQVMQHSIPPTESALENVNG